MSTDDQRCPASPPEEDTRSLQDKWDTDQRTHTLPQSTQDTHGSQDTLEIFSDSDKQVETYSRNSFLRTSWRLQRGRGLYKWKTICETSDYWSLEANPPSTSWRLASVSSPLLTRNYTLLKKCCWRCVLVLRAVTKPHTVPCPCFLPQFSPYSTEREKLNMTFLQETHSTLVNEPDWKREWTEKLSLSHRSSNSGWWGSSSPKTLHLSSLL